MQHNISHFNRPKKVLTDDPITNSFWSISYACPFAAIKMRQKVVMRLWIASQSTSYLLILHCLAFRSAKNASRQCLFRKNLVKPVTIGWEFHFRKVLMFN